MRSTTPRKARKKRKTQGSAGNWSDSSMSVEICGARQWGGDCRAHTWQLNLTKHRGSFQSPHRHHPSPRYTGRMVFTFMQVLFMAVLGGLRASLSWEYNSFPFVSSQDEETHVERTFCPWQTGNQTPFLLELGQSSPLGSLSQPLVLKNFTVFSPSPEELGATCSLRQAVHGNVHLYTCYICVHVHICHMYMHICTKDRGWHWCLPLLLHYHFWSRVFYWTGT